MNLVYRITFTERDEDITQTISRKGLDHTIAVLRWIKMFGHTLISVDVL